MNNTNVMLSKWKHEIKNPLAVCTGYLEMISNSDETSKEKYLEIIKKEIQRSLSIINNFKLQENSKLQLEEFEIAKLLEEIQISLNSLFKNHNSEIIVITKEKIYLKGDYHKLEQVLINIIKNAYEAKNNKKLLIVIKILSYPKYIKLTITDNGKGMTKKELKNIWKNYYTTKKKGTGLGIPFCQDIITLHNGKIYYESKKNIGTKVTILLPK